MKYLIAGFILSILSGCMTPNAMQPQSVLVMVKHQNLTHKRVAKRQTNKLLSNTSTFLQDGVPIVNLMAHQGGENA